MPDLIPHSQPPPASSGPRWWHRYRNPLWRRSDKQRVLLGVVVALAVLVTAPLGALLAGTLAQHTFQEKADRQERERHRVTLTLLEESPRHPEPGSPEARHTRYPVPVRWTDPAGGSRTGTADAPSGLAKGSTFGGWCDDAGALVEPPMTPGEVRNRTLGWTLGGGLVVVSAGLLTYLTLAERLERRTLAAWERAWAATGPRWTTST